MNKSVPLSLIEILQALAFCTFAILAFGCASVPNSNGVAPRTIESGVPGPVAGVGIEAHDIVAMTDQMVRDMLGNSRLANGKAPPRVIVDAEFFVNDSQQ